MEAASRRWLALALGLAVACGFLVHVYYYGEQINDDAFITFRYSHFLASGSGPVFNPGEHVEGYTNFLLMLMMSAAIALFGQDWVLVASKAVAVLSGLAALLATRGLCRLWLTRIEPLAPHAGLLSWAAAALLAAETAYAFNSTTGLETTQYSACVAVAFYLHQLAREHGKWRGAGVAFALAALARPDGIGVFGVFALATLLSGEWRPGPQRRRWLIDAGIVVGVVVAHSAFRYSFYDGEFLPNTYYAKADGVFRITAGEYVLRFLGRSLGWVAALLAVLPLIGPAALRRDTLPALAVGLFSLAAIFQTGPDWMPASRMLVPYLPLWFALGVTGVGLLAARFGPRAIAAAGGLCAIGVVALLGGQAYWRGDFRMIVELRRRGYLEGHVQVAEWLNKVAQPGDTVALMDIGLIGYLCPQLTVLDVTGLTDRTIAKAPGRFLDKRYDPAYVMDRGPEFLVIAFSAPKNEQPLNLEELLPWSAPEQRLVDTEAFRRNYFRPRPAQGSSDPLERLGALVGAERFYEHVNPTDQYYFLAVYLRRQPESQPAPASDEALHAAENNDGPS